MRSTKTRPYRMNRRAAQVDQTRERITEAAVRLHTTVGPIEHLDRVRGGGSGRDPPDGVPPLRRPGCPVPRLPRPLACGEPSTGRQRLAVHPGSRSTRPDRFLADVRVVRRARPGAVSDLPRRPEHASRDPGRHAGGVRGADGCPARATSRCRPGRADRSARSRDTCSVCGRGDRSWCSRVYRARKPLRWQSACSARPLRPTARDRAADPWPVPSCVPK